MSNGSEHTPERGEHAVDGPDWAGLRELYPAEVDYKTLVEHLRAFQHSHEVQSDATAVGGVRRPDHAEQAARYKSYADAVEALVAENEKMRPVFEFVQGLNGNIDEIHEFMNSRDALQARLDAMTTDFRLRRTGVVNGKVAEVEPFYEQRLVGPWTVVPEGDTNA